LRRLSRSGGALCLPEIDQHGQKGIFFITQGVSITELSETLCGGPSTPDAAKAVQPVEQGRPAGKVTITVTSGV